MNRNYKLDKETTQRLLDLAVEDNLVKLHKKVGTKGELFLIGTRCPLFSNWSEGLVRLGTSF